MKIRNIWRGGAKFCSRSECHITKKSRPAPYCSHFAIPLPNLQPSKGLANLWLGFGWNHFSPFTFWGHLVFQGGKLPKAPYSSICLEAAILVFSMNTLSGEGSFEGKWWLLEQWGVSVGFTAEYCVLPCFQITEIWPPWFASGTAFQISPILWQTKLCKLL